MNHLLAIDAGNTRLKWALHDGVSWCKKCAIPVDDEAQLAQLREEWTTYSIDRAIVSNVAGERVAAAIERALKGLGVLPQIALSRREQCGVINHYTEPAQLGSDRWAALVAAHRIPAMLNDAPTARLVAMAGTALTVDALTEKGEFLGGVIVPGPGLMGAALNRGTALLPAEPGRYEMFPTNTLNAIATGAVEACVGTILRLHAHLALRTGRVPTAVLSGGASEILIPYLRVLSFPLCISENLVLDGLVVIANDMNAGGKSY